MSSLADIGTVPVSRKVDALQRSHGAGRTSVRLGGGTVLSSVVQRVAILLAHRIGEAVQGRGARLSTGGHLAGLPSRSQVTGILREIDTCA